MSGRPGAAPGAGALRVRHPDAAHGPGRALVAVYGVLAVAATFRSGYQIATDLAAAPLAYGLSAVAAVVYVVATVALARGGPRWRPVAWFAVLVELVGVLVVGAFSLARPDLFPEATVWSGFGRGYGFVPLVLPVLGIWWLRHAGRLRDGGAGEDPDRARDRLAAGPDGTSAPPGPPRDR